ncbi:hypothetical protein COK46_01795 [Bacillus thuringiensis]|uniref:hypothetical protein n=1 Tax=Bacillus thuringiensis TaxID=1428 RepID=UPI000BF3B1EC|nr:hypothetical protein [Bacillus thuringiensis]PFS24372.1 hypothetical protein COK46_01795 [Bacillus thuringiensis]
MKGKKELINNETIKLSYYDIEEGINKYEYIFEEEFEPIIAQAVVRKVNIAFECPEGYKRLDYKEEYSILGDGVNLQVMWLNDDPQDATIGIFIRANNRGIKARVRIKIFDVFGNKE